MESNRSGILTTASRAGLLHRTSMAVLTLQIDNMHCGACVRRVLQALNALPETRAEEVRVGMARVHTESEPAAVEQALGAAGFPARAESQHP